MERREGMETETRRGKQIANELCNDITRCIYVHTQEMTLQPTVLGYPLHWINNPSMIVLSIILSLATRPRWDLLHVCVGWEGGGIPTACS